MGKGKVADYLIPQVSKLPGQKKVDLSDKLDLVAKSEFKSLLKKKIDEVSKEHGINLSVHAAKRMNERSINMDGDDFFKIKDAIGKLREKGGKDSLVITDKAIYVVDVDNNKIVTAMDKDNVNENVFTKIDSTVIVN
ncbi:MAG: flagellar protein [Bacteriovoracaceae bacterium]|jgi:flagellar operon protein|nr:flagellar protein [Bacteriovoracaceae bacterium]